MLRWSTGSFLSSKASICTILNFVGRGKCSTPAVNVDSVCYTRASMETRARPFTASFMWLSSYWMSWNRCSQDCSPFSYCKGLAHHLRRSCQAYPHYNNLRGVCRDHVPWSGYFLLLCQRLGGTEVLLFLLWNGIAAFTGLLCLLWVLHLSGEFRQLP